MASKFHSTHWDDSEGNPLGGISSGLGFAIGWQHGPLGHGEDRREPNGASVETIINVVIDRLKYHQKSKFASEHNASALTLLNGAVQQLRARTKDRENRGVEGKHAA